MNKYVALLAAWLLGMIIGTLEERSWCELELERARLRAARCSERVRASVCSQCLQDQQAGELGPLHHGLPERWKPVGKDFLKRVWVNE